MRYELVSGNKNGISTIQFQPARRLSGQRTGGHGLCWEHPRGQRLPALWHAVEPDGRLGRRDPHRRHQPLALLREGGAASPQLSH